jgi:hypothetical protein
MKSTQFTVAFTKAVSIQELANILKKHFGDRMVEVGSGMYASGVPHDWIVVDNERPRRMD